jgi:hypothetical protein
MAVTQEDLLEDVRACWLCEESGRCRYNGMFWVCRECEGEDANGRATVNA